MSECAWSPGCVCHNDGLMRIGSELSGSGVAGGRDRPPAAVHQRLELEAVPQLERVWLSARAMHSALTLVTLTLRWRDHRRPRVAALVYGITVGHTAWLFAHLRRGGRLSDTPVLLAETAIVTGGALVRPVMYDIEEISLDSFGLVPLWGMTALAGFHSPRRAAPGIAAAVVVELSRVRSGPEHLRGRSQSTAMAYLMFAANGKLASWLVRFADRRTESLWSEVESLARRSGEMRAANEGGALIRRPHGATHAKLDTREKQRADDQAVSLEVDRARTALIGVLDLWAGGVAFDEPPESLDTPATVSAQAERYLHRLVTSGRLLDMAMLGLNTYSSRRHMDRPAEFYALSAGATLAGGVLSSGRLVPVGSIVHQVVLLLSAWREPSLRRIGDPTVTSGLIPIVAITESMTPAPRWNRAVSAIAQAVGFFAWRRRAGGRPSPSAAETLSILTLALGGWVVGSRTSTMFERITARLDAAAVALSAEQSQVARLRRHERRAAVVHNKLKNATDLYLAGLLNAEELVTALESAVVALEVEVLPGRSTVGAVMFELAHGASFVELDLIVDAAVQGTELGASANDLALVVEELLTNAARHSPDRRATVRVGPSPVGVEVVVTNGCAAEAKGSGHGLRQVGRRAQHWGASVRWDHSGGSMRAVVEWPV